MTLAGEFGEFQTRHVSMILDITPRRLQWLDEKHVVSPRIKQGLVPAALIPLVAIDRDKIERVWPQMERQAADYGKRIRLCRFRFVEVVRETKAGS